MSTVMRLGSICGSAEVVTAERLASGSSPPGSDSSLPRDPLYGLGFVTSSP